MSASISQIQTKAIATINALKGMSQKEREQVPSRSFGDDYNKIRSLALEAKPDLEAILPPAVTFKDTTSGPSCKERYVEIFAYLNQISDLLAS